MRERIAEAIWDASPTLMRFDEVQDWKKHDVYQQADAVLAVLPLPSAEVRAAMRQLTQSMRAIRSGNTFVCNADCLDRVDAYLDALEDVE